MEADEKQKLLILYPEYDKVYGPYLRSDGRKHVILSNTSLPGKSKDKIKTISYPKAISEIKNGRHFLPNETTDHQDRNKTNDNPNNLIIRDRVEHSKLDATHVYTTGCSCPECGSFIIPTKNQLRSSAEKAGPFCSKKCTGIYGAKIQNGGKSLERNETYKFYYLPSKEVDE